MAPRSRRERPSKPALTRDGIIAAALEVLRAEGLEKVTMRRIAAVLDTGPASLYVYVRNTEDLHAQLLDDLLGSVAAPDGGTWRERLAAVLVDYARVLFDYPGIARNTLFTRPSGPNYLTLVDLVLGLLHEGGVPDQDAAWAVDLLLQHATATAAEQSVRRTAPGAEQEVAALVQEIRTIDPDRFPHIARLGDELMSGGPARFHWALDVLISGILTTNRKAEP